MDTQDRDERPPMSRRRALTALAGAAAAVAGMAWLRQSQPRKSPGETTRLAGAATPVFYTPAYVGAAHVFETTRKAAWVADSVVARPIAGVQLRANLALDPQELARCHDPGYIEAVRRGEPRALAQSQGFAWDPGLWPMVLASNGGLLAAARAARENGVAGALASGMHHARRAHGAGFCTFNGLAIAALAMLAAGARRILIIDLDAHCGGGTHSLLAANPSVHQLDIAVHGFDHYVPVGADTLDMVPSASRYLPTLARRLRELDDEVFDLCLYNAGMDPHEGSAVGGLAGIDATLLAEREQRVFSWCRERQLPIAFALAGGYLGPGLDAPGLVALHRLTLEAAAPRGAPVWSQALSSS